MCNARNDINCIYGDSLEKFWRWMEEWERVTTWCNKTHVAKCCIMRCGAHCNSALRCDKIRCDWGVMVMHSDIAILRTHNLQHIAWSLL